MKKIGVFLLAVALVVGVAGCGGGGDDFSPTVANMAGVYTPTMATVVGGGTTVTFAPPDISGTLNLTTVATYTIDMSLKGERMRGSGPFAVDGSTIIFDGGDATGPITDDGRKFSLTYTDGGSTVTLEFTRT